MKPTVALGRPALDPRVVADIWRKLDAEEPVKEIAVSVGVSKATIYRERKVWIAMRNRSAEDAA